MHPDQIAFQSKSMSSRPSAMNDDVAEASGHDSPSTIRHAPLCTTEALPTPECNENCRSVNAAANRIRTMIESDRAIVLSLIAPGNPGLAHNILLVWSQVTLQQQRRHEVG